jgi:hypothetical protein
LTASSSVTRHNPTSAPEPVAAAGGHRALHFTIIINDTRSRIVLSDVATSRWMRGDEHSADMRAFALVQTLANNGADVAKIEELSWSPPDASHGGLRTTLIYGAQA